VVSHRRPDRCGTGAARSGQGRAAASGLLLVGPVGGGGRPRSGLCPRRPRLRPGVL